MPTPQLPDDLLLEAGEAYLRYGGTEGARKLGMPRGTFESRVKIAVDRGLIRREDRTGGTYAPVAPRARNPLPDQEGASKSADFDRVRALLSRRPATLDEIATEFRCTRGQALDVVDELRDAGVNVHQFGEAWSIEKTPAPQRSRGALPAYTSRPDGTFVFGFTSDNHLGSKYARLDVLDSLYDHFARIGVDRVFNAGNWIDGEKPFNRHDLLVHGMDAQLRYLVANYPQRKGITTFAVAGDDHEGWYCQSEGIDIGRHAENTMRDAGREDWVDLGFMEAYVRLVHAGSGQSTMLHVMHPGGGSAYAVSYTVQKIVEGYDGGDKPACLLAGHYHKLSYNLVRNVHAIQTGTTQDQTPFMRKKKLSAHVGGGVCRLTQDAATGAITACAIEFFNYFVRDFYNDRWSHSGDVQLADRGA